jgi:membrane-associated protease RseP (regulator of RpoE activity)
MADWDPYLITLGLVIAWSVGVFILQRRGILERHHITPWLGPILMWRTERGKAFLDRLARRRRFWEIFGDVSIALVVVAMFGTLAVLVWEATLVPSAALRANPPALNLYLALPGVNPIIPIGYGILGLVVAIVLHEFSHGILARTSKIKVRSLGGLFFVVPIGAFVEPDEDELRALPKRERARLFAAGPGTNLILALIFAVLFSTAMITSVQPVHSGVAILGFTPGSPAAQANMTVDMIITRVNGTDVNSLADLQRALSQLHPTQAINVSAYDLGSSQVRSFPLQVGSDNSTGTPRPILGIYAFDVSTDYYFPLANPGRFGGVAGAFLSYVSLPFQGRAPIQDPATRFYQITGPLAIIPAPLFWGLMNSFYWIFWLSAALGTFNSLPAVPFDGGYMFRDGIEGLVARFKRGADPKVRERIVRRVTYFFAFAILALILWQVIGPRI